MLVVLGALALGGRMSSQNAKPEQSAWRSYTTDCFFGLRWRWQYGVSGRVEKLLCFCPRCDYQVYPVNVSPYAIVDEIAFSCDSCGSNLATLQESPVSLADKVIRTIHQKIRRTTGEFKLASDT